MTIQYQENGYRRKAGYSGCTPRGHWKDGGAGSELAGLVEWGGQLFR
jgi:hypothetical protein